MAQQTINVGAAPNDGTGTPLRTAFQYTNSNFTELYTAVGPSGNNIVVPGTATISGDLTVDTSTLKVDSANNRVGIKTATPTAALQIASGNVRVDDGYQFEFGGSTNGISGSNASNNLSFYTNNTIAYSIGSAGGGTWYVSGSTAMTLDSTGLGVGASPVGRLNIANTGADVVTSMTVVGVQRWQFIVSYSTAAFSIYDQSNSATRLLIDTNGNVGVGVTPSAGRLHIKGGASQSPLVLDTLGYNQIVLQLNGANRGQIYADATNCFALVDSTGSNLRLVVTDTGNVGVGVSTFGTSAAKVIGIANGTAPSTSPAGMGQLYVEAGALKYRGSSGTVTTIANA